MDLHREGQLRNTHWSNMMAQGSRMARFMGAHESGWDIVKLIINNAAAEVDPNPYPRRADLPPASARKFHASTVTVHSASACVHVAHYIDPLPPSWVKHCSYNCLQEEKRRYWKGTHIEEVQTSVTRCGRRR